MPSTQTSRAKSLLMRAFAAYGDEHRTLFVDLHGLLVGTLGAPFIISTNAVSLQTEDVFRIHIPLSQTHTISDQCEGTDPTDDSNISAELGNHRELVDEHPTVALTPRDLVHRTYPPVHRPSFSFEPAIILSFIHNNVQRIIVTCSIDLYIQYAKAQRGNHIGPF